MTRRLRWLLGLGLAVGAVAAVPTSAVAAQTSDKPTATISLRYTGPVSGAVNRTVVLEALGPAPSGPVTLVDEEGRTTVRAQAQDLSRLACSAAPRRATGLGTDRWCLQFQDIRAGAEVTGKLSGPQSVVTVKVAARHPLWLPSVVAVVVLLFSASFVFYTTNLMGERVSRLLLAAELRRRSNISGLKEWAEEAKDHLHSAQIRSLVAWMRRRGSERAVRARARLEAAEQQAAAVLPECPLREEARREAASKSLCAADLVSPKGEIVDHPAAKLEETLLQAVSMVKDFHRKVAFLLPQVEQANREAAEAIVKRAHDSLAVLTAGDVDSTLRTTLDEAVAHLQVYAHASAATAAFLAVPGLHAFDLALQHAAVPPIARDRLAMVAEVLAASVPVVAAIVVLMGVATVAALSTSYAPKRAFGTAWDYVALVVAVFASTSVTGIVAAAVLWRRTPVPTS